MKNSIFKITALLFLLFGSIFFGIQEPVHANSTSYTVITNFTYLYPTAELPERAEDLPKTILYFGDKVTYMGETVEVGGVQLVRVSTSLEEGYLVFSHLITSDIESLKKSFEPNAEIKNENTKIFSFDGKNFKEISDITLKKGTGVRLTDGFDQSKEYLAALVKSGEDVFSCYVKTSDISVSGVSLGTVIAVILIIFCAFSASFFIFIYFKHKNERS